MFDSISCTVVVSIEVLLHDVVGIAVVVVVVVAEIGQQPLIPHTISNICVFYGFGHFKL